MRAIHEAAQRMDTYCRIVSTECDLPLGLKGAHQRRNAALALAALRALPHFLCSAEEEARGLAEVRWPGRFEEVQPGIIMDGAHNPHAMQVLTRTWRESCGGLKARCIYAGSADKALDEVLELLSPIVGEWVLPPVQSPRILSPAEMAVKVHAVSEAPVTTPATLEECLVDMPAGTLICGSFFLLGEAKAILRRAEYRSTVQ